MVCKDHFVIDDMPLSGIPSEFEEELLKEIRQSRESLDLHPKKTMICIWWDWEGIVPWEMHEGNATANKELYISQLQRVKEAIRLKRPHR
ncbi:hypothetical protein TNCV_3489301 [Trichonephila clavipes]|nr:hypothetical protein TNCV_3489301 [Trichonephila clavipes]